MGYLLRRPRAVLRKFDPSDDNFAGARIIAESTIILEALLRSREVWGAHVLNYRITRRCFFELRRQRLIVRVEKTKDGDIYMLSKKAKNARLRKS